MAKIFNKIKKYYRQRPLLTKYSDLEDLRKYLEEPLDYVIQIISFFELKFISLEDMGSEVSLDAKVQMQNQELKYDAKFERQMTKEVLNPIEMNFLKDFLLEKKNKTYFAQTYPTIASKELLQEAQRLMGVVFGEKS
ncbi:MAG: hypothetical protein ACRC80_22735 [Waterburya sp.]